MTYFALFTTAGNYHTKGESSRSVETFQIFRLSQTGRMKVKEKNQDEAERVRESHTTILYKILYKDQNTSLHNTWYSNFCQETTL